MSHYLNQLLDSKHRRSCLASGKSVSGWGLVTHGSKSQKRRRCEWAPRRRGVWEDTSPRSLLLRAWGLETRRPRGGWCSALPRKTPRQRRHTSGVAPGREARPAPSAANSRRAAQARKTFQNLRSNQEGGACCRPAHQMHTSRRCLESSYLCTVVTWDEM